MRHRRRGVSCREKLQGQTLQKKRPTRDPGVHVKAKPSCCEKKRASYTRTALLQTALADSRKILGKISWARKGRCRLCSCTEHCYGGLFNLTLKQTSFVLRCTLETRFIRNFQVSFGNLYMHEYVTQVQKTTFLTMWTFYFVVIAHFNRCGNNGNNGFFQLYTLQNRIQLYICHVWYARTRLIMFVRVP